MIGMLDFPVSPGLWLAYCLTVFFVSGTPGPNMLLALSRGVSVGPRRTAWVAAGAVSALMVLMAAAASGLDALAHLSPTTLRILRLVGAAYLAWIGVKALMVQPAETAETQPDASPREGKGALALWLEGFLVSLSNPKGIAFFVAFFPQFLDTGRPILGQSLVLGATFALVEFSWFLTYARGGRALVAFLARRGGAHLLEKVSGCLLLLVALVMAATAVIDFL